MSGATISVTIKDEKLQELLARIATSLGNMEPAFKVIGETVRSSVVRNFEKGGRPGWPPLSETTVARRKKSRKTGRGPLVVAGFAGGLLGSISFDAGADRVTVGTNKVYGALHQFGAKKGSFGTVVANVRAHIRKASSGKKTSIGAHSRKVVVPWGDIPARPFLMVQNEDWKEIRAALERFVSGQA